MPDDRRRLRVKDITRKSIEDIYSFREIMETRSLQKIVEAIRNKDYDTAYFYLKRDHFDRSIGGRSVADLVEQRLQTLRAAEKSKKKYKNSAEPLVRHCFFQSHRVRGSEAAKNSLRGAGVSQPCRKRQGKVRMLQKGSAFLKHKREDGADARSTTRVCPIRLPPAEE
ncbi:MAG: hypothetical protein KH006_03430 [Firmicutes bacterium]|nr:hypothetical protein [Bacillota bacterium]